MQSCHVTAMCATERCSRRSLRDQPVRAHQTTICSWLIRAVASVWMTMCGILEIAGPDLEIYIQSSFYLALQYLASHYLSSSAQAHFRILDDGHDPRVSRCPRPHTAQDGIHRRHRQRTWLPSKETGTKLTGHLNHPRFVRSAHLPPIPSC